MSTHIGFYQGVKFYLIVNRLIVVVHSQISTAYIIGFIAQQIQETHTAYSAGTQYTSQSLNKKQHTWLHRQSRQLSSVKPCMLFFIQTLPRILCAGAISRVSFLGLFEPFAGAINPIM